MELRLFKLPPKRVRGTYDLNHNNVSDDFLPDRMCYLAEDAAQSYLAMDKVIVFTDLFRSAAESLEARARKRGVQPPAYSAHNFGLAWDVDVDRTLQLNKWTYAELLTYMEARQWWCHRRDGKRGMEDWHFSYLGPTPSSILSQINVQSPGTWARGAELAIQQRYAGQFNLTPSQVQACLKSLKLYSGGIDGSIGPISMQGVNLFARTWEVPAVPGNPVFQRTLAYVAAEKVIVNTPIGQ
jgi:hypothetical protein